MSSTTELARILTNIQWPWNTITSVHSLF